MVCKNRCNLPNYISKYSIKKSIIKLNSNTDLYRFCNECRIYLIAEPVKRPLINRSYTRRSRQSHFYLCPCCNLLTRIRIGRTHGPNRSRYDYEKSLASISKSREKKLSIISDILSNKKKWLEAVKTSA